MEEGEMSIILGILLAMLRSAIPLIFAALGGMCSERAGVVNIALEGLMLMGAFVGAVVALSSGSAYIGFFAGGIAGLLFAQVFAFVTLRGRANHVVAGMAMNLLAIGMIPLLLKLLYDSTGATPSLPIEARFEYFPFIFVWVAVILLVALFRFTPFGLWLTMAGEHPNALATAGVSPLKVRYIAVSLSGLLAGFGGACLSLFLASAYSRNMVAGRGFMAIAALIFGKWRPVPTALACLFFALTEALQIYFQGMQSTGEMIPVPMQLIHIFPYIFTMIVLAGAVGKARAPKALGQE
jgi:general nucleoside transport system permease protein